MTGDDADAGTLGSDKAPETGRPASPRNLLERFVPKSLLRLSRDHPTPWLCFLLFLLVAGVFLPSIHNDFVNFDDQDYVTANPHVQGGLTWAGLRWALTTNHASNWHPLTWLSHMADCQLFGLKSWGHHLTSVLLHAVNAILVFVVLSRLTGARWRSLFVAAFFGLHPLRVQSVAWVSERKDLLSALFSMLTLWAYARYTEQARGSRGEEIRSPSSIFHLPSPMFYLLALFVFALALLSKPMAVTLPFVLLLLDYWPLNRFQTFPLGPVPKTAARPSSFSPQSSNLWRLVAEKIPFLVLAAAASVITLAVQRNTGAVQTLTRFPFMARVGNALIAYCGYLGKLFYPVKLAAFYPHPGAWPASQVLLALFLLAGISVLVVALRRQHPYLLIGWLWYAGTLVPAIGLVQVGAQAIADRYTYIPLIGVCIMLAWSAYDLTSRWRYQRIVLCAGAVTILLCCTAVTRRQIAYWADSETLFRRALAVTKNNALAHLNLGVAMGEKGRPEAFSELETAASLAPDAPDLHLKVGDALAAFGYPDDAIAHYQEAISLKPDLAEAHNSLGVILSKKQQFDEAISQFQAVLRLSPGSADAHDQLGLVLGQAGRLDEAVSQFREAIRLKPDLAEAHNHLGVVLIRKSQFDEAITRFQQALSLKPNYPDAHVNLGVALYNKGDSDQAISQFQQALKLQPGHAQARTNLNALLDRRRGSTKP